LSEDALAQSLSTTWWNMRLSRVGAHKTNFCHLDIIAPLPDRQIVGDHDPILAIGGDLERFAEWARLNGNRRRPLIALV
jgi:hypothetical protein